MKADVAEKRKDHISHFILRLVYCRRLKLNIPLSYFGIGAAFKHPISILKNLNIDIFSEDLKRWFISQEMDLFRHRFTLESAESVEQFLRFSKLNYEPVSTTWSLVVLGNRY